MGKQFKTIALNRSFYMGLLFSSFGILVLFFALRIAPETISKLRFSQLGTVPFKTQTMSFLIGALFSIIGGITLFYSKKLSTPHRAISWIAGFLFISLIFILASMGKRMDLFGVITQSLRLSTPIVLGAMAGVLCERSGVVNIAIEGMMLMAACLGYLVTLYTQSLLAGCLFAAFGGAMMATLHAILSISFKVDQIVSGTVINILAIGISGFIRRALLIKSTAISPGLLPVIHIPYLSDMPVIGNLFFRHQPIIYITLIIVVLLHFGLYRTRWGLRSRAVGENPQAADALGINVKKIRYINVILSGCIAGLGGAWFSLETVGNFHDLMTGGKGFIALAAMIFGKWTPFGATSGAFLFGFSDALQIKLQVTGINIPYQILGMVPYVVTMVILAGFIGRAVAPAADGIPYSREG